MHGIGNTPSMLLVAHAEHQNSIASRATHTLESGGQVSGGGKGRGKHHEPGLGTGVGVGGGVGGERLGVGGGVVAVGRHWYRGVGGHSGVIRLGLGCFFLTINTKKYTRPPLI